MKKKAIFLHVFIPLLIGSSIYIFFRSTSIRVFKWINFLGIRRGIEEIRYSVSPSEKYLPIWVKFSLPDCLWVYSFTSAIIILWQNDFNIGKYFLLFPVVLGCLVELAQLIKIFPGTFDIVDLLLNVSGFILSIVFLKPIKPKHDEKENVF